MYGQICSSPNVFILCYDLTVLQYVTKVSSHKFYLKLHFYTYCTFFVYCLLFVPTNAHTHTHTYI